MAPELRKRQKKVFEFSFSKTDIISHIPNVIKEKILINLPLKEATRTSLLSRSWRNTWITIPKLDININLFPEYAKKTQKQITRIVDSILSHHKGPINEFKLRTYRKSPIRALKRWVSNLSINGIKDLDLALNNKMDRSFFSCNDLNMVDLSSFSIELPLGFGGFKFLNSLKLSCVSISDDDCEKLVSRCPKLENFELCKLKGCVRLKINGGNLKTIKIITDFRTIEICAPKLVKVLGLDLINTPRKNNSRKNNFTRALGFMPEVEILNFGIEFLKYLSYSISHSVPLAISSFQFPKLKKLKMEMKFEDRKIAAIILSILEKSPNLEKINIMMEYPEYKYPIKNFWGSLNPQNYLFENLKVVKIHMFEFESLEDITLSFLKIILGSSPNLEKVHLFKGNFITELSEEESYLGTLNQFAKASINAQIVYEEEDL